MWPSKDAPVAGDELHLSSNLSAAPLERRPSGATAGLDRAGALASGLCAAHCAASALLPAALAALGLGALFGPSAEWLFTIIAVAIASTVAVAGWRRMRFGWAGFLLAGGIVAVLASRAVEMGFHHNHDHHSDHTANPAAPEHGEPHGVAGPLLGGLGGILLVAGHLLNLRAVRPHPHRL